MKVQDVKVYPVKFNKPSKMKANASFTLDGKIKINCTVVEGPRGLFVGFPGKMSDKINEKTGKKTFYSDVYVSDEELKEEINNVVVAAYNAQFGGNSYNQDNNREDYSQDTYTSDIPF